MAKKLKLKLHFQSLVPLSGLYKDNLGLDLFLLAVAVTSCKYEQKKHTHIIKNKIKQLSMTIMEHDFCIDHPLS